MTDQATPEIGKIEDVFKDIFWDSLAQGALGALFSAAPYLAVPVVKQVIVFIVMGVTNELFALLRLTVDITAIKFINAAHQDAFDSAMLKLKIIAHDRGIDSPEFKKAREDAKLALSKFVRFGAVG